MTGGRDDLFLMILPAFVLNQYLDFTQTCQFFEPVDGFYPDLHGYIMCRVDLGDYDLIFKVRQDNKIFIKNLPELNGGNII